MERERVALGKVEPGQAEDVDELRCWKVRAKERGWICW